MTLTLNNDVTLNVLRTSYNYDSVQKGYTLSLYFDRTKYSLEDIIGKLDENALSSFTVTTEIAEGSEAEPITNSYTGFDNIEYASYTVDDNYADITVILSEKE